MITRSEGIVLRTIKYSETSLICSIFTRELGLLSFMQKGVLSAQKKGRGNVLQPGTILEMELYFQEKRNFQRLKEFNVKYIYRDLHLNMMKRSVFLFLLEFTRNIISEKERSPEVYDLLINFLTGIDGDEREFVTAPIDFMLESSQILGFAPAFSGTEEDTLFDMLEGVFTEPSVSSEYSLDREHSLVLRRLLLQKEQGETSLMSNSDRRKVFDTLLRYFRIHHPGFQEMKTPRILRDLLSV